LAWRGVAACVYQEALGAIELGRVRNPFTREVDVVLVRYPRIEVADDDG